MATVVDRTPPTPGPADLVVLEARVWTLDNIRPEAEAFAVSNGRFRVVGTAAQVRPFIGPKTRVVRAAGAAIVPGLIDAHLHLFGEGLRMSRLDLTGTRSLEEVLALVRSHAAGLEPGAWLEGRGWDQNDWPVAEYPSAALLDTAVGDRPAFLVRIDGHAAWVNSQGLIAAGIGADTPEPPGGRILRDPAGSPTGILIDNAIDLVRARVPKPTREAKRKAVVQAARECVAAGLTSIHEPGIGGEEVEILKELCRAGEMPLRVYVMLEPGEALERYLEAGPEVGLFDQHLTIRAVKLYADGALGSRGAALLKDYADDPGNRGLLTTAPEEMERVVRRLLVAGLQPCIHAIGDRANREVLDLYQRVYGKSLNPVAQRPRIEHAQIIARADLPRFARLGVIASMQPTHATSDMPWVAERLGAGRSDGLYAWQTLLRSGAHVSFGSDAPVESVRPLLGIQAAVTRADGQGQPPGGWIPTERLTVEQALHGYATEAAYAGFEEDHKGTIAPGRLADFVLLGQDLRTVPPERLAEVPILATYVGGIEVFNGTRK